ncbi:MAG: Bax inhibitor-1/YccA family protein [Acidimicrobiales bacterium]
MAAAPPSFQPVANLDERTRSDFIVRVYQHVLLAVLAFVGFEAFLLNTGIAGSLYDLISGSTVTWLLILGGFMVVNWLAANAAHDLTNTNKQYAGLFALAAAEAIIFAPFLYLVFHVRDSGSTVWSAAFVTVAGFAGLSAVAYNTRRDLSFLRPMILWGFVAALILIVAAILFGFNLGVWFSVAMIALAGASILYQTQVIMRQYPAEAYVGGAVQLFASVMLLFWYVLRLFSEMRR